MTLTSWLQSLKTNRRRPSRSNVVPASVEHMEDRALLSVAALFVGGELFVSSDSTDSIAVRQNAAGRVEVLANGAILGTAPNVATSSVTSIVIKGGDDGNNINLNEVTSTTYPSLGAVGSIRVEGGNGDDVILGSPSYGDSILGGDGADSITGQAGNDTLDGGDGNDTILGQDGDDSLIGEDGADSISGNAGNDTISGGDHADVITGDDGDDSIDGGNSSDTISGGNNNDFINGGDGTDSLNGDAGNDSMLGGAANDVMSGDVGNDTLLGQAGADTLNGNDDNDSLNGGDGNDSVSGNLGNDAVNGGAGNDALFGNEGDDLILGGAGNDTLDGFLGNDTLRGQSGNDSLFGGGGSDNEDGGDGNDVVDSGDPIPEPVVATLTVSGGTVVEGDAGTSVLTFTVSLSAPSFLPVSVTVNTADGTATSVASPTSVVDYTAITNQVFTIAPGTLTTTVNVQVASDLTNEINETVRLVLSNPTNAKLQSQESSGTITNDDAAPLGLFAATFFGDLYRVDQATAATTLVGNTFQSFVHDISQDSSGQLIGFTQNGPALYSINTSTAASTNITFVNGVAFGINVEGDMAFDTVNNVIYYVTSIGAGNPHLFRIDPSTGAVTDIGNITVGTGNLAANTDVIDMDYLSFRNGTLFCIVGGGITGTNATFNDSLFSINPTTGAAALIGPLGFNLNPQAGGLEYDAVADQFLLLEGSTADLYRVSPTTGAATRIGPTGLPTGFDVASGLSFAPVVAQAPRGISVGDVSVIESDQLTTTLSFVVSASPGAGTATVGFTTVSGTATAGVDFVTPASGTLTFGPSGVVQTQLVTVTINGEFNPEADETFFLQLSNVTGAALVDGSGTGTILNNDAFPLGDTLTGSAGNDTLIGGAAGDLMNGGDGTDSILGNGGDDTILGGASNDTIDGGDGNDSINGQGGADVINGGAGDDIIVWEGSFFGSDTVSNSAGADGVLVQLNGNSNTASVSQSAIALNSTFANLLVTEGGATLTIDSSIAQVTVDGGNSDDTITIGDLQNVTRSTLTVRGGNGEDLINATGANTGAVRLRLEGGDGNDTLVGGQGNDTLEGNAGIDRLKGGDGNDLAIGGVGIDSISGENGNDTLIGGDGTDTLVGDGQDTLSGDAGNDSLQGNQGNDILNGGDGNDTIRGGDGNDTINGDAGNDSLLGETASDSVSGGDGDDTLDGGRNNDILNGGAGNDKIRGDHGNDTIAGGSGDDTINGGDGDDVINGQAGDDLITGADGDDTLNGAAGNDIITGGDGDDNIAGGDGNDVILGEQGDDIINGQGSTDTLAGGQGDDTIIAAAAGEVNELFVLPVAIRSALSAT